MSHKLLKALVIALAFVVGAAFTASAAGKTEGTAAGPISISFGVPGTEVKDVNLDEPYVQELTKKTGVKISKLVFILAPYAEKYAVLINSGDLPDVFQLTQVSKDDINTKLAKTGNLFNFKSVFNKTMMPNMYAWYEFPSMKPQMDSRILDGDGNFYVTPMYYGYSPIATKPLYRKDLFDEAGLTYPKNLNEFYTTLKALKDYMKKAHNIDHYPISRAYGGPDLPGNWFNAIWGTSWGMYFDDKKDEYRYGPSEATFREAVEWFKKAYSEGILQPEYMLGTPDDWNRRLTADQVSVAWYWDTVRENTLNRPKRPTFNFVMFPPFTKDGTSKVRYEQSPSVHPQGYSIFNNTKVNKDALVKFIDYFYSFEGSAQGHMGIEGISYEKDPTAKLSYDVVWGDFPYKWTKAVKTYDQDGTPVADLIKSPTSYPALGMFDCLSHGYYFHTVWGSQESYNQIKAVTKDVDLIGPFPSPNFTADENNQRVPIENQLNTYRDETITKYIIGKSDKTGDAFWTDFNAQIKKIGYEGVQTLWNTVHKRK